MHPNCSCLNILVAVQIFVDLTALLPLPLLLLLLLLQAEASAVFPDRQLIEARSADGVKFYIGYNKLAICTGSQVRGDVLLLGCYKSQIII
jgi:hypothetical protein